MRSNIAVALAFCFASNPIQGATVSISGVIEGSSKRSGYGETIDYLKFEMLSTSNFTLAVSRRSSRFYTLAAFTGDHTQFEPVSGPSVLFFLPGIREESVLSRTLEKGLYVLIMDAVEDSQYDFGDGFVPVNFDGGNFTEDWYSFNIEGDLKGIEYWEGQFDPQPFGSFKITMIPEPSTASLIGGSALLLWQRNPNARKENKALQRTPRGLRVFIAWCRSKALCVWRVFSRP